MICTCTFSHTPQLQLLQVFLNWPTLFLCITPGHLFKYKICFFFWMYMIVVHVQMNNRNAEEYTYITNAQ